MPEQRTGHLLRIPRTDTDSPNDYVLLRANPSASSSTPPDAYLLATEGEAAYGLRIKNATVHKFLSKAFTGTHEEFRTILFSMLLHLPVNNEEKTLLEGIGISATVEGGTITLAVRKSVGGIKQRIAAIDIPQTEDEIELYTWVGEVCMARDESDSRLQAKEERVNELEKEVEKLVAQLTNLTKLKQEHEDAMLIKFQELLNRKKQHIRELTRRVDAGGRPDHSIDVLPSEAASPKCVAKVRNPRKRATAPTEEEDDSDFGFAMAAGHANDDEEDMNSDQRSNPPTTDDEAEAEASEDEEPQHVASTIKNVRKQLDKGKRKAKATTTASSRRRAASAVVPAKPPARSTRASVNKPATATAAASTRGRGRGGGVTPTAKVPEPEEERPSPPPVQLDNSDATAGATDDDEL